MQVHPSSGTPKLKQLRLREYVSPEKRTHHASIEPSGDKLNKRSEGDEIMQTGSHNIHGKSLCDGLLEH